MLHLALRPLLRLTIFSLFFGFLPPAPFLFTPTPRVYAAPQEIATAQSTGAFPATSVLDTFNRTNGTIGNGWAGDTASYAIQNQQLTVSANGLLSWNSSFGANQEAFVTLPAIGSSANEIDLLLKRQDTSTCNLLEVWYQPSRGTAQGGVTGALGSAFGDGISAGLAKFAKWRAARAELRNLGLPSFRHVVSNQIQFGSAARRSDSNFGMSIGDGLGISISNLGIFQSAPGGTGPQFCTCK